jgi:hypothetical protein
MTQLDEKFVAAVLKSHPAAALFINTLAEEVRRLERLGERYESTLMLMSKDCRPKCPCLPCIALNPIQS